MKESTAYLAMIALFGVLVFSFMQIYPSATPMTGLLTSQVGNFSAAVATYLACTWSTDSLQVGFVTPPATLNPGTNDNPAVNNTGGGGGGNLNTRFNATNSAISNVAAKITIKGENFTSGGNVIAIGNATWVSNQTDPQGDNLIAVGSFPIEEAYDAVNLVTTSKAIGDSVYFRFWLDIPAAQVAGTYEGNYTMLCQQA